MCCAGSASQCLAAQPDTAAEFSSRSAMRSCSCSPTPQTPSNSGSRWTVSSTTNPNFPHCTSAHTGAASSTARMTTSAPQSISPRAWHRPARQARFLITEDLRDAAGDLSDAEFASLPPRRLKGIPDPILLVEVRDGSPERAERETDPVCGMRLHPDDVTTRVTWRGMTFAFCSKKCHRTFVGDPGSSLPRTSISPSCGSGKPNSPCVRVVRSGGPQC
jgi:YHS domain-containing protein